MKNVYALMVVTVTSACGGAPAPATQTVTPSPAETLESPVEPAEVPDETDSVLANLASNSRVGGRGGVGLAQPSGGLLSKEAISQVIRDHLGEFSSCYATELIVDPALNGKVDVSFTVGADGTVVTATATGLHPNVEQCVVGVLYSMVFPKPLGGGQVVVNYPFNFQPN